MTTNSQAISYPLAAAFAGIFLLLSGAGCGGGTAKPSQIHGKSMDQWREQMHSKDAKTRKNTLHSLGKIGAVEEGIPALAAEGLADADASVRLEALIVMEKLGQAAKPFLTQIRKLQTDADEKVRQKAIEAAKAIETIP